MSFPRPEVDIRAPPAGLDELIEWLDQVSYGLVLLEEYSLGEIQSAVEVVDGQVRRHLAASEPYERDPQLVDDHVRFLSSLEQLRWFLARVEQDGEAGHGQALGQYGRVLAEALRRHRAEELLGDQAASRRPDRRRPPATGKP